MLHEDEEERFITRLKEADYTNDRSGRSIIELADNSSVAEILPMWGVLGALLTTIANSESFKERVADTCEVSNILCSGVTTGDFSIFFQQLSLHGSPLVFGRRN